LSALLPFRRQEAMAIQYGAEVVDRSGRVLGTVNHVVRNTWTGGIRKFMVRQKAPNTDLLLSPEDVLEETESKVTLRVTLNELEEKLEP
jgi:sporulation protein YlmC with PRC-barrel domain